MMKKCKFVTLAAVLALAVPITGYAKTASIAEADKGASLEPAPVTTPVIAAVSADEASMGQKFFDKLSAIFDAGDKATPIAPAQLALAQKTAGKIMPDGTLAKMMGGMVQKFVTPLIDMMPDMSATDIMGKTGIYEGAVENLDEKNRKELTAMFDPARKDRGPKAMEAIMPLVNKVMASMEAPMRTGLARAYARKFSAQQLTQINGFFATPAGAFYASEAYALQADPEVLRATFQAMPMMLQQIKVAVPDLGKEMDKLPKERTLADLNDAEMARLAGVLGVPVATLEEQRILMAADVVAQAAADAAVAVADDPAANETGQEPWYNQDNWAKATRKNVQKLLAGSDAASMKSGEAYAAWDAAYNKAVAEARERYKAEGWKPTT